MTYYIKGGSRYNAANPKVWTALFLGGYSDSLYDTTWENLTDKGVETNKDPYWRMGSSSGGAQTIEFGLYNDYRIEIDQANGIRGWNGSGWIDLLTVFTPDYEGYIDFLPTGVTIAQINTAISNMSTAGGGIVQLPEGTIAMGATVLVMQSNVWLRGATSTGSILHYTSTQNNILCDDIDNWRISDLKIYNTGIGYGLKMVECVGGEIDHCWFLSDNGNSGYAIYSPVQNAIHSHNIHIHHNKIETWEFGMQHISASTYVYDWGLRIDHNIWLDFKSASYNVIYIRGRGSHRSTFCDNIIYTALGTGNYNLYFRDMNDFIFSDNIIVALTTKGIRTVLITGTRGLSANNIVVGYTDYGIGNTSAGGINVDNILVA